MTTPFLRKVLLAAFGLVMAATVLAQGQKIPGDAQSASAELAELLKQAETFSGEFEQRLFDREGHLLQTTAGRFALQRPGNFYWETLPPYEQVVVGNADKLWVYDPDLEQVTVRNQSDRQQTSPAQLLSGDLRQLDEHYNVSRTSEEGARHFILESKGDDGVFERLQLEYENGTLVGLEFEDSMGQVTDLNFLGTELNPDIDSSLFQFEIPEGVDVIVDN